MTKATRKAAATKPPADPDPDPEAAAELDRQQEQFETVNPTAADVPGQLPSGPPWFIAYDHRLLRYVPGWYASEATAKRAAQAVGVPADQVTVESYEPTNTQSVGRSPA